jgi:hypothetical protein
MSQDPIDHAGEKTSSEIRQGDKGHGVRYVLVISLVGALVLLFVVIGVLG